MNETAAACINSHVVDMETVDSEEDQVAGR